MKDAFLALVVGFFIGGPAYLVGYPHKEVYRTIWDQEETAGGVNILQHNRDLIDADFDKVVKPNNDTLYTLTSLDVSDGPLVLTIPETGDRYWSVQFMATSTEVEGLIGRRNHGGAGGQFVLAPDGWQGDMPAGAELVSLPSNRYWMLTRMLVDGVPDLSNVHALQDSMTLEKL